MGMNNEQVAAEVVEYVKSCPILSYTDLYNVVLLILKNHNEVENHG